MAKCIHHNLSPRLIKIDRWRRIDGAILVGIGLLSFGFRLFRRIIRKPEDSEPYPLCRSSFLGYHRDGKRVPPRFADCPDPKVFDPRWCNLRFGDDEGLVTPCIDRIASFHLDEIPARFEVG
jgi:hypothetical protein